MDLLLSRLWRLTMLSVSTAVWHCILLPSLIGSQKEQIISPPPSLHVSCCSARSLLIWQAPSIIKLIGVADLGSSALEMAPLVAINDRLTDSLGFNPNYTWESRAKTEHLQRKASLRTEFLPVLPQLLSGSSLSGLLDFKQHGKLRQRLSQKLINGTSKCTAKTQNLTK